MSVNDLISLSLDEIIARGGPKFRTNRRPGIIRREGGTRRFRDGVRRIPIVTNRRPKGNFRLNNLKRDVNVCIVNISNLGPMVTTTDLQELFAEHPYEDVAVQYEPDGSPSGTAVVIFKRFEDGMKLKRQFTGVRLDGEE
ncbi:hypothetical protein DINM_004972 [Dirofilaria immitis]|nr:hypothetical protein [Dirofilaria immitis]